VRILYLDCFSGIAGDMLLGALLDLGLDASILKQKLKSLPLKGYTLHTRAVLRQGISGTKFDVRIAKGHHHRGWKEIQQILNGADLDGDVREKALQIFKRLITAEARIHRVPMQKVHLHEVGAVDAIVDIVGAVIGLKELLGSQGRLWVSPLHLGKGRVKIAHGTFPIPAPATAELLKGIPVQAGPVEGELVTPTGAAIVSTLAAGFGPMPPMKMEAIGYGAGTRQYEDHPNMLRAVLGDTVGSARSTKKAAGNQDGSEAGEVLVVQCNIDDMNPQGYGHLMDQLFDAGALEVYYAPVQMKKNRPGTLVTLICHAKHFTPLTGVLFRESTTIGLRHYTAGRVELSRDVVSVKTSMGMVRVKVSSLQGSPVQAQPEYEDCRKIAKAKGIPLKEVTFAAMAAYRSLEDATGSVNAPLETVGGKSPARVKPPVRKKPVVAKKKSRIRAARPGSSRKKNPRKRSIR
jgi:uncharacterized protein (TIGR00299 family) protein